jgi:AraC-like DNA-binding protein
LLVEEETSDRVKNRLDGIPEQELEDRAKRAGYRVKGLAQLSGLSLRRLEQCFPARFGLSPKAWFATVRFEQAQRLLLEKKTNKEVAGQLCYKSEAAFCRAFRKKMGVSPQAFASSLQEPSPMPGKDRLISHLDKKISHLDNSSGLFI